MSHFQIPLTKPLTGPEELAALAEVLQSGWLTHGPRVTAFEQRVASYLGVAHAAACSNCTTALHLALLLHHIGPGDEVILPSYTWIATANAVRMVGAVPVFADIEIDTFNVSQRTVEAALTDRTRAILLVHQFGLPVDVEPLAVLARAKNLALIEDAACALGGRYRGRPVGALGNVACFSFHPRKLITIGEGGMLVTDQRELADRARGLINHAASVSGLVKHQAGSVEALLAEEFREVGYNYRMTNLQGALGVVQMQRLESILNLRRRRAERYTEAFARRSGLIPPRVPEYAAPNWQSYVLRIGEDGPVTRNQLGQHLLNAGIACRPAYMACHVQPVYREFATRASLPNTERALQTVLILPLYPQMTDEEQAYVIKNVLSAGD